MARKAAFATNRAAHYNMAAALRGHVSFARLCKGQTHVQKCILRAVCADSCVCVCLEYVRVGEPACVFVRLFCPGA